MLFKNAKVFHPDFRFERADVRVEEGRFTEIAEQLPGEGEDLQGLTLLPGLCDIHSHGCVGCDWSRNDLQDYRKMARYYAQNGVTSICATTMSLPAEKLREIMADISRFMHGETGGTTIRGINMEGPFFSKKKKGAQAEEYLIAPDIALFETLQAASGGNILLCDIAPELEGAESFIRALSAAVTISVAHTAADYETVKRAISLGARHATHLYNAMTPFSHREPGAVGAVFDSDITAELIADGIHLNPATLRITFRVLGGERCTLVSDSMEACGMPDGIYELGGQEVTVKEGRATLASGTIAGSATNLYECMCRAIRFGVRAEDAIRAASATPARVIGREDSIGAIDAGRCADFLVCDEDYHLKRVYVAGREIGL